MEMGKHYKSELIFCFGEPLVCHFPAHHCLQLKADPNILDYGPNPVQNRVVPSGNTYGAQSSPLFSSYVPRPVLGAGKGLRVEGQGDRGAERLRDLPTSPDSLHPYC